ncbi:MAG: hypothetical protein ACK4TP_04815 [Hyphomicrobium sp.]
MKRSLVAIFLGTSPAAAVEYRFSCTFEQSALPITDPVAKEWLESSYLRTREFIMEMDPPKIVTGPGTDAFWGVSSIRLDAKEVRVEWEIKAKPLDRRPRIVLTVNRFSGEAFEIFAMLEKPNQGPEYAYGSHRGQCGINPRKL